MQWKQGVHDGCDLNVTEETNRNTRENSSRFLCVFKSFNEATPNIHGTAVDGNAHKN